MEGFLRFRLGDNLQQAGNVQVLLRDDSPPDNAVGTIRANHDRGVVLALVGNDHHPGLSGSDALNGGIFMDGETAFTRFGGQPGVEFMPADSAESKLAILLAAHLHTLSIEIEMCPIHVHVRDFSDIQAKLTQHHFGIRQNTAAAQLGARVVRFFEDQRAGDKLWSQFCQVERSGDPCRAGTHNDDLVQKHVVVISGGHRFLF